MNGASKRARAIDYAERAAGEEDQEDDGSCIGHPLGTAISISNGRTGRGVTG